MALDPKLEKKIDTLYRNTRLMPLVAALGVFVPFLLLLGGPLGLLYWSWRRALLADADSGRLTFEPTPPPLSPSSGSTVISTAAKFDFVRNHKHALLVPLYLLVIVVVLLGAMIAYFAVTPLKRYGP